MRNRSIIIMVLVLIGATGYLLLKSDGNVDMSGEKHGTEANQQTTPDAAPTAPTAVDAKK